MSADPRAVDIRYTAAALLTTVLLPAISCNPPSGGIETLRAPAGITTTTLSPDSIRIDWSGAQGCNVFRADSEVGAIARINAFVVMDPFYVDTGLSPGTVYWHKVAAVRNGRDQTFSNAYAGITAALLDAPQKLPGDGQLRGASFARNPSPQIVGTCAIPFNTVVTAVTTSGSEASTSTAAQDTSAVVSTQYP